MNDADILIEKLKQYYKVGTLHELANKLGVAQNTVSGWRKRNSTKSIYRKIYELDLDISLDHNLPNSIDDEMEEMYSLILDHASYSANVLLQMKFENDFGTFLNTYLAKGLLQKIIEDLSMDKNQYTPSNMKNEFLSRVKGLEVGLMQKPGQKSLSQIIERYFSKLQVYAIVHYPEIVFNHTGYFGTKL